MKKNLFKMLVLMIFTIISTQGFAQNKKVKTATYGSFTKAGTFTEYVSKNGDIIKVGDSLQIGVPSNFEKYVHITQNDAYLKAEQMNKKLLLKNINVSGDNKKGYNVYFTLKGLGATPVFVKYEDAFETKEIVPLTKNETTE